MSTTGERGWIDTLLALRGQRQNGLRQASQATITLASMVRAQLAQDVGVRNAGYLSAIATELLGTQVEGTVPLHLLLSALERSWRTGHREAEQQMLFDPAYAAIRLEDVRTRAGRKFTNEQKNALKAAEDALRAAAE